MGRWLVVNAVEDNWLTPASSMSKEKTVASSRAGYQLRILIYEYHFEYPACPIIV